MSEATEAIAVMDRGADAWRVRVDGALEAFPGWPRTDRIGEARCHVFQCADVLEVWLDTIGRARRTQAVFAEVTDGAGRPAMLLPLGIERSGGVRVLGFLDGSIADYTQPVLYPVAAALDATGMKRLWRRLRSALPHFDVALFDKMPGETGGLRNPLMHLRAVAMPESGHAMHLPETSAALEARMPAPKNHLRLMRKLNRESDVALEVARDPEQADAILSHMIENKARKFAETRVPGFELPGKLDFYRETTRRLLNGPVHLSAIRIDGTVVASHWGLVMGDRFLFLMPAYTDGPWRKYAPGRMLNEGLIRRSHADGLAWCDFGIGDEAYKDEYCETLIPLYAATVPVTLRGRAFVAARATMARLRASALWQRLRPYKWVVLRALRRDPAADGSARARSAEVDTGSARERAARQRPGAVPDRNAIGHGSRERDGEGA